jgi:hypothetical protein
LELWNVASGARRELATKESAVLNVNYSPDSSSIVAAGQAGNTTSTAAAAGVVELWSAAKGSLLSTLPLYPGTETIASASFSAAGDLLYIIPEAGGPGSIQVVDPIKYKLLGFLNSPSNGTIALSADGTTAVTASPYEGLTVLDVPALVSAPITGLKFDHPTIPEWSTATATVTIATPAPVGGLTLEIETSSQSIEWVQSPSTVTIPAGKTSATFEVGSYYIEAPTPFTVTALSGLYSLSNVLTVLPPNLSSLSLNASSVVGGGNVTGTVRMTEPPHQVGTYVWLTSNNAAAVTPTAAVFNAAQSTATFTVTTKPVTKPQKVTITAQLGPVTKTVTLTVLPPH